MTKTILLVDDQELMLRLLKTALRKIDALIYTVKSGEDAVRHITENGAPDVIIMDYFMPSQDGVETLRQIRNLPQGQFIPVMMLTARDQTLIRAALHGLHIHAFVTKPFSPNELTRTVMALLDEKQKSSISNH